MHKKDFKRVSEYVWELPATYRDDMRVPARLYASDPIIEAALGDQSLQQLVNTATLPGLVQYALAMPDIHQGYGFPIGGVIASRTSDGDLPCASSRSCSRSMCRSVSSLCWRNTSFTSGSSIE